MRLSRYLLLTLFLFLLAHNSGISEVSRDSQAGNEIEIPYTKFVLDNGLTLIIHEDHKAPIVAVNLWYHVGSKNEKIGKSGFAHLFEHLMFNGSEHNNQNHDIALERVGATDLNGTTNRDRTNYFQTVPTSAIDVALWMESDRMGHLLGVIDSLKLEEQRGVVQNEKRQGENQPYGQIRNITTENSYPKGHPYSWTTIGSMEDLNAASLEDVHEWFKAYYGAANAVIVVAGDIQTETVKTKVEKYFGDIPSGPPITRYETWVAKRENSKTIVTQDRVPQGRLYRSWNVPEWGTETYDYLNLVSDVLSVGKTSRLYKRLVYDDQIATDVAAYVSPGEISTTFTIRATARPGENLEKVKSAINEELKRFLAEGPTKDEMKRIKTGFRANFIRGAERIGGFGGKSDILAQNEVYGGSPDFYKTTLSRAANATTQHLFAAARKWLSSGDLNIEVYPFPEYTTLENKVDRSVLPEPETAPVAEFPALQRATLSNGLQLILAERHSVPIVDFSLQINAGYAADQFATAGTAKLAMDMLDEGTKKKSALQVNEDLAMLGANINSGSNLDMSFVNLSTLKTELDAALKLYAEVILEPAFSEDDFKLLQNQQIAGIQREKSQPLEIALRVFPKLIYGDGHAYSNPFRGSGFENTVSILSRDDLKKFHQTWFKPNNATLVITGDITLIEIQPKLEKLFKDWKSGDIPEKNISKVEQQPELLVYLMDKPGAQQSIIFGGHVAPEKANPDEIAIEAFNDVLGGTWTSRIYMNLREDKHWSYGAWSILIDARGQRPYFAYAPVQTDKTKESIIEVKKELSQILSDKPVTSDELTKIQKSNTLSLPGHWETIADVRNSINEIVRFNLNDNYHNTYTDKILNLKVEDMPNAGRKLLHIENIVWVIVGDLEKIEPGIRELNLGEIRYLDPDGNIISATANR